MSPRGWTAWAGVAVVLSVGLFLLRPADSTVVCPSGTTLVEARPPAGLERWCGRPDPGGHPVRHGPYRAWYPDGRVKIEGQFVDDAKDGRWTYWHGNGLGLGKGQKKEEGVYRAGRPDGRWTRWYSLGPTREEGDYRNGVREGRWASWYEIGQKEREGEYREGQEAGVWLRWNPKGEACPPEDRGRPVRPSDDRAGVSA